MSQKLEVKPAVGLVATALMALKAAIVDAWSDTRAQMVEYQYHRRVIHTAFGQFLVHNVRNKIGQIETPGVISKLVANRRGSAYHVQVTIGGNLLLTVSAVNGPQSHPRFAQFRDDYISSLQSWFRFTDGGDIEMVSPASPNFTYVQVLHGPKGPGQQERQELGFIQVAFPCGGGMHSRPPISLDAYIAEWSSGDVAEPELVEEEDNLGVSVKSLRNGGVHAGR